MVVSPAPSAFWRNRRFALSSMTTIVTWTLRLCISASAAATIVLIAARFKYFLDGRSAAVAISAALRQRTRSFSMGDIVRHAWRRGQQTIVRVEMIHVLPGNNLVRGEHRRRYCLA